MIHDELASSLSFFKKLFFWDSLVNQALSASAVHKSLIPIKKTVRTLYCCVVSHNSNKLHITQLADHRLRIFAEWIVDVILLQVDTKCFSMRMSFDLFLQALELGDVLLPLQLSVTVLVTLKSILCSSFLIHPMGGLTVPV